MNTLHWDAFTERERTVIDDALRIYLGEIVGNCANAATAETLRMELRFHQPGEVESDIERDRR